MALDRYHHGDLRSTLLREADAMLRDSGLESLSLRRLAAQAGVSATALYHHFRDKNDLLCALAERGFVDLEARTDEATLDPSLSERDRLRRFVRAYVGFAGDHPEIYDLMFGRVIWKAGAATASLRAVAHGAFRRYLDRALERSPAPGAGDMRALRRAQAGWATLHGLCRLLIDGIYVDRADLDAMSDEAVDLLLAGLEREDESSARRDG